MLKTVNDKMQRSSEAGGRLVGTKESMGRTHKTWKKSDCVRLKFSKVSRLGCGFLIIILTIINMNNSVLALLLNIFLFMFKFYLSYHFTQICTPKLCWYFWWEGILSNDRVWHITCGKCSVIYPCNLAF